MFLKCTAIKKDEQNIAFFLLQWSEIALQSHEIVKNPFPASHHYSTKLNQKPTCTLTNLLHLQPTLWGIFIPI